MPIDYFIGDLRCPACGAVSREGTDCQTHIRGEDAHVEYLGVGSRVDASPKNMADADYVRLKAPTAECRILQFWTCPACKSYPNWAEIVVFDDVIREVKGVALTRAVLDAAHYIDGMDGPEYAARLGAADAELGRAPLLEVLRRHIKV